MPPQRGRHVLITGANRGLGLDMARAFAGKGAMVTMAVRNTSAGEAARRAIIAAHPGADIEVRHIDLEDLAALRGFAAAVMQQRAPVDVLINNAGVVLEAFGKTRDGFERHLGVNHLAPFVLSLSLLPHLQAAPQARVVGIASLAHRLCKSFRPDDFTFAAGGYTPMEAYGRSKLATLLFTSEFNRRLQALAGAEGRQTTVAAMAAHPGYSRTNLDKGNIVIRAMTRLLSQPTEIGALPLLYAATQPGLAAGSYIGPRGLQELRGLPGMASRSAAASDADLARSLWQASEAATGMRFPGRAFPG